MAARKKKTPSRKKPGRRRRIRTVLIPNRGEIALRVVRTVRALGLRAVVAHSEVDGTGAAVEMADDAILLGPASPAESYLSVERILEAARRSGADAIHPGYGFLSEREHFARAVEDAGLVFVGPTAENIRLMGDKIAARSALQDAGIAVVPGERRPIRKAAELRELARKVGLPLLLKAAAGGGGKGIRLVRDADSLEPAFRLARSEAEHAFGDPTLFAERFLERARHVEVQVIGDGEGGARVYPERDCSTQRRHQKLLEETPCPALDASLREKLLGAALHAVQLSRYRGAGTLEFLFDGEAIYFLEMNTRLQVEHPVTEMVCGVDLVAEQLAVADGKTLEGKTLEATRVQGRGAAVEFRVNAEDPDQDFLPSTGRLENVHLPGGPGVRIDSAARDGMEITPFYDSLIAKVIARGEDRARALQRLRLACEEFSIEGVTTTIPVALALLDDAEFLAGRYHCQYLGERLGDAEFLAPPADPELDVALAVAAGHLYQRGRLGGTPPAALDRPRHRGDATADDLSPWARLGRTFGLRGGEP